MPVACVNLEGISMKNGQITYTPMAATVSCVVFNSAFCLLACMPQTWI